MSFTGAHQSDSLFSAEVASSFDADEPLSAPAISSVAGAAGGLLPTGISRVKVLAGRQALSLQAIYVMLQRTLTEAPGLMLKS